MSWLNFSEKILNLLPHPDSEQLARELFGTLQDAAADGHSPSAQDAASLAALVARKQLTHSGPLLLLGLLLTPFTFIPSAIAYEGIVGPNPSGLPPWEVAPICAIVTVRALFLLRRRSFFLPIPLVTSIALGIPLGETYNELETGQSLTTIQVGIFAICILMPLLFLTIDFWKTIAHYKRQRRLS